MYRNVLKNSLIYFPILHTDIRILFLLNIRDYTMILHVESKTDPKAEDLQTVTPTNLLVNNKNLCEEFVMCKNLMGSPNIVIGYDELPIHIKIMVEVRHVRLHWQNQQKEWG